MKVYLVETVQHRVCVCVRECRPSLKKSKRSSPFFLFTHKVQLPTGVQLFLTHERDMVTPPPILLISKKPTSDSQRCCNCCVHLKCLQLVQKIVDQCKCQAVGCGYSLHSRTPLPLSVDLEIAFWFLNDRKQREDLLWNISYFFF